mmetsp:Transcript_29616/g.84457  ORF Transcript_29616/g.84457 Transcript_29616/m.84457 type:complete len:227 (+) Transcript_29616:375-1055(+)
MGPAPPGSRAQPNMGMHGAGLRLPHIIEHVLSSTLKARRCVELVCISSNVGMRRGIAPSRPSGEPYVQGPSATTSIAWVKDSGKKVMHKTESSISLLIIAAGPVAPLTSTIQSPFITQASGWARFHLRMIPEVTAAIGKASRMLRSTSRPNFSSALLSNLTTKQLARTYERSNSEVTNEKWFRQTWASTSAAVSQQQCAGTPPMFWSRKSCLDRRLCGRCAGDDAG